MGAIWLRLTLILTGVLLMGFTMLSLARRRMTDSFVLTWGLISIILIFAGIFLNPAELARYISGIGIMLVGAIAFCLLFGAYFMSIRISELIRRNLELSMQVTLIRQELEELERRLERTDAGGEEEHLDEAYACGHQYAGAGRG